MSTPTTPKATTAPKARKVQRCGACKQPGHNRRTCPITKAAIAERANRPIEPAPEAMAFVEVKPASKSPKKRKAPCCGECGKPGHNKRTCPILNQAKLIPCIATAGRRKAS